MLSPVIPDEMAERFKGDNTRIIANSRFSLKFQSHFNPAGYLDIAAVVAEDLEIFSNSRMTFHLLLASSRCPF